MSSLSPCHPSNKSKEIASIWVPRAWRSTAQSRFLPSTRTPRRHWSMGYRLDASRKAPSIVPCSQQGSSLGPPHSYQYSLSEDNVGLEMVCCCLACSSDVMNIRIHCKYSVRIKLRLDCHSMNEMENRIQEHLFVSLAWCLHSFQVQRW